MGLGLLGSSSMRKCSSTYEELKVSKYDPNPSSFIIKRHIEQYGHTIIWINYPNCKNYEGDKIILFKNTTFQQIEALTEIDPHFTELDTIKPFARFEPTKEGWKIVQLLLNHINLNS